MRGSGAVVRVTVVVGVVSMGIMFGVQRMGDARDRVRSSGCGVNGTDVLFLREVRYER